MALIARARNSGSSGRYVPRSAATCKVIAVARACHSHPLLETRPRSAQPARHVGTFLAPLAGLALGCRETQRLRQRRPRQGPERRWSCRVATVATRALSNHTGDVESEENGGAPAGRGLIVALVALAYVIWQMDKVNMSVAVLPMAAQFGWDAADEGLIQSSIFWGYASTQVLGGFLATRFGGKRVLLLAVAVWSLATIAAPYAATVSTEVFVASRVLVGLGEGLAPASGLRMVATWVPEEERSRAVATLGGGKTVGSIAGLLLAPVVITNLGWQAMFFSFGLLGLGWALIWAFLGKDREATTIAATTAGTDKKGEQGELPIPWQRILSTPQLWAVVTAHFCHDWGGYALLTWTPTYLNQALGYNLQGSSSLTVIPSLLAVALAALGGAAADNLHNGGMGLTQVRKTFQGLGFFLPCAMLGLLGTLDNVDPSSPLPIALLTVGIACGAFSYAGLYSSHADLSAKYSGLVNGISTTFGALAGVCSNAYAGYMLKSTGSWAQAIFLPSVALYLVGWVVYAALYDATPIDWDAPPSDGKGGGGGAQDAQDRRQAQQEEVMESLPVRRFPLGA